MQTTVTEHDGLVLARIEDDDFVFEVNFETIEPTDVTLRFRRDGEKIGSVYNDDGTEKTMARLTTARGGNDFMGVRVPKSFVSEVLTTAVDSGRVTDESAAAGYRLRVLDED
jgi:hypothetical protein